MSRSPKNERGFSLVEVVVSMTLLAVALASLARPTYLYARRAVLIGTEGVRDGIVAQQVNRLTALPYDSLASRAGCRTVAAQPATTACVTLTAVSSVQTTVTLVVSPTGFRPDTVEISRTRATPTNPFST